MLVWYDEPPRLLRQAVRSAAVICDRIVAADGAYELVTDPKPSSPPSQRAAIRDEARKHGLEVAFVRSRIWPGQVAKRDFVLQIAKQDSDWVMVLDADWHITGDRDAIRAELESLHQNGYEQVSVSFIEPENHDRYPQDKYANVWHEREAGQARSYPFIYRVMPVMRYRLNHWSILCETEDGRKIGLFGGTGHSIYGTPKTGYLHATHLFEHLCLFRDQKQIIRNREYISRRDPAAELAGYET